MKNKALLILSLIIAVPLHGQSFDPESNYIGISASGRFSGLEFEKLGINLFYTFSGKIDIGADTGFYVDSIQSQDAQNIIGGAHFYTYLLSPYFGDPFSLKLGGSYFLLNTRNQYLIDNNYSKKGNGFTLEMEAMNNTGLFRYGFFILYEAVTMQLLDTSGGIINTDAFSDLSAGALAGITLSLDDALILSGEIKGAVTTGFHIKWSPGISLIVRR